MPSVWIKEFTGGLDTRRLPETTPGGVLIVAQDGHITRGGEFEQRAAFVPTYALPAGTIGMAADNFGILVFGHLAEPGGLPDGVRYQQLAHPTPTVALVRVLSYDLYSGLVYAVGEFEDGTRYHFYNGVRVADWYDGRSRASLRVTGGSVNAATGAIGSLEVTGGTSSPGVNTIASVTVAGVTVTGGAVNHTGSNVTTADAIAASINAFTSTPDYIATSSGQIVFVRAVTTGTGENGKAVAATVTGTVSVGNFVALAGGTASTTSQLTDVKINGVSAISAPVLWDTSNSVTAAAIAQALNDYSSTPDYEASATGDLVSITATETGVTPNGRMIVTTVAGGFALTPSSGVTLAGGTASASYIPGTFVKTIGSKEYSVSGPNLHFSGIKDPTHWTTAVTGAGFIDMSSESSGSEDLKSLAKYQNALAIFAERAIQIWYVDPDPDLNKQTQVLINTGTASPRSVTQFGDNDLFYLDESGLRSLRARDASNSAATTDIGIPVDTLVVEALRGLTDIERGQIFGLIEPQEGRFWLTIKGTVFVFSYFPGSKVSAWSTYTPGFNVEEALPFRRRVYVRSGDTIYVYGGLGADLEYDDTPAIARLPYLDAGSPTAKKTLMGVDAAMSGQWELRMAMQPTNLDAHDLIATVNRTTFNDERISAQGESTHFGLIATSKGVGPHKLGALVIHFEGGKDAN